MTGASTAGPDDAEEEEEEDDDDDVGPDAAAAATPVPQAASPPPAAAAEVTGDAAEAAEAAAIAAGLAAMDGLQTPGPAGGDVYFNAVESLTASMSSVQLQAASAPPVGQVCPTTLLLPSWSGGLTPSLVPLGIGCTGPGRCRGCSRCRGRRRRCRRGQRRRRRLWLAHQLAP